MRSDMRNKPAPTAHNWGAKAGETPSDTARRLVQQQHAMRERERARANPKGSIK